MVGPVGGRRPPGPAVHQVAEPVHVLLAPEWDQRHFLLVPRLEADGRRLRDGQPHPEGGGAVELQGAVDLEEVIVRADLDRPVAGVADLERDGRPTVTLISISPSAITSPPTGT